MSQLKAQMAAMRSAVFVVTQALTPIQTYAWKQKDFPRKINPSVIDNCKITVSIKADGATHVGGLIGTGLYYYGEETVFKVTNCSVTGSIDGAVTPGTVAGRAVGSVIESCDADILIDGVHADNQIGTTSCMYESADQ